MATPCAFQVRGPPQCCQLPHSFLQQQAMLGCQPPTRQVTGCHLHVGHLSSAPVDLAAVAEGQVECAAITVHMGSTDITTASIYIEPRQAWDATAVGRLQAHLGSGAMVCGNSNAHQPARASPGTICGGRGLLDAAPSCGMLMANTGSPTFTRPAPRPAHAH